MRHRAAVMSLSVIGLSLWASQAWAGALGIPLDAFLTTFLLWVQGLGAVVGAVGLLGWVGSMFENPFTHLLAGSVGYFTKAGILGGGLVILPMLGLIQGALLP
jgi:hypothetical protein